MSDATISHHAPRSSKRPLSAIVWLVWMVGMWVGFFVLLAGDLIDDVWHWARDLPLLPELALWLVAFPWMLGSGVWTSSWPGWLRLALVLVFAAAWTLVSIPRRKPPHE